jgi:hypothetical protein
MEFINTKNSDVSDLFKDLNLPLSTSKSTRLEIEDYYVEVNETIDESSDDICQSLSLLFVFFIEEIQAVHVEQ